MPDPVTGIAADKRPIRLRNIVSRFLRTPDDPYRFSAISLILNGFCPKNLHAARAGLRGWGRIFSLNQRGFDMSMKKAYEQKVRAQLDEWQAEVDKFRAKAADAEADTKIAYYRRIDELRAMQDRAEDRLEDLKQSGDDAWDDLKAGVESATQSLSESMTTARSRFG